MTDPIADMLTRIRNALQIKAKTVTIPHSRVKTAIVQVLLDKSYISGFKIEGSPKEIVIDLKYIQGHPALTKLQRISTPGRRLYSPAKKLPQSLNGYGTLIVTTSQGIISDDQARTRNVGGEILCEVY